MTSAVLRRRIKISGICLFLIYITVLIHLLFFSEGYGRGLEAASYSCNLLPFREIKRYLQYWELFGVRTVALNLAGNVIGFVPFGALLPIFARSSRKAWKVTLLSLEISALVEFTQLIFRVGCFDVDDMILNTLGGFLGYLLFWSAGKWYYCMEHSRQMHQIQQRKVS